MSPVACATTGAILALALLTHVHAQAPAHDEHRPLVALINDYRQLPTGCPGRPDGVPGPLTSDPRLAEVWLSDPAQWADALREADYPAAHAQAISLSGSPDPAAVMGVLKQHYCQVLLDPRFSAIGVQQTGNRWLIVLAQPLLTDALGTWTQAGKAVLAATNRARAEPRRCGGEAFEAADPLVWNETLAHAALAHSQDMAAQNYFAHRAPDGSYADERARRAGYRWLRIGENLASGPGSADEAVRGWLASPEHCRNLMNPAFEEMGAAYAVKADSDGVIYWTQLFGTPR
ncbi:CAP domain-containing protein [Stutzerimonas urumqiensis]|uniref:CAP domain-containing protein n=1 Tax=Stutzerimonas urumqiensis TaxID=638269 RepID=UPI003DA2003E